MPSTLVEYFLPQQQLNSHLKSCKVDELTQLIEHQHEYRPHVTELSLLSQCFTFISHQSHWTLEQKGAFLGIIWWIHRWWSSPNDMDQQGENPNFGSTASETYREFKRVLLLHTLAQPPFSVEIFNLNDTKQIAQFVCDRYMKHYKAYQYILVPKEECNVYSKIGIEGGKFDIAQRMKQAINDLKGGMGQAMTPEEWEQKQLEQTHENTEHHDESEETEAVPQENEEEGEENEGETLAEEHEEQEEAPKLNNPVVERQLEEIRSLLSKYSLSKLDDIRGRLSVIEQELQEKKSALEEAAPPAKKKK